MPLRNIELHRFMPKYHPMGELAPRDVVARAILHELEVSQTKDPVVYLDLTHLDPDHVKKRFPRIYATCMQFNIDITTDMIPIRPCCALCDGRCPDATSKGAALYPACTQPEKQPRLECMVRIAWRAIPCSRVWCSAREPARACVKDCAVPQRSPPRLTALYPTAQSTLRLKT